MANTGFAWGAFAAMQKGAGDWTADAIADAGTETGDATTLATVSSAIIGIKAVEDNTGAIDGTVTVYALRDADGTNYEAVAQGTILGIFTPVQNSTIYKTYTMPADEYNKFKLAIFNDSGQEIAFTVTYATSSVPVAS